MQTSRREFLHQLAAGFGVATSARNVSWVADAGRLGPLHPPSFNYLRLVVQTRAAEDFDSSTGSLRLFSGTSEIRNFGSPPPAVGKVKLFSHFLTTALDRDTFVATPAFLGLGNSNQWFPRLVFLYGEVGAPATAKVPLAVDLGGNPNSSLSTSGAPFDRWPLQMLTPGAVTDPHELLLLHIRTHYDSSEGSGSAGPFEVQVFSDFPGDLLHHTTLSRVGLQDPAETNGDYLAVLAVNPGAGYSVTSVKRVVITNRSDDAWIPAQVEVFSLSASGPTQRGRHLGSYSGTSGPYVSQDPNDVRGTRKPQTSVAIACTVGP